MFCPNCGTQNPDNATSCFKCGFNLTGAAAPKFKGTMLMGQQPPGGPPPVAQHGGGVGHAPMPDAGLGATVAIDQVPELAAMAAGGPPPGGAPPPAAGAPPGGGYPGAPGGGYPGAPPGGAPGGFGAPPGGAPPGGAPGGFGAPPGGAPGGFGAPPGGAPPGGAPGGFGAPGGAPPGGAPGGFGAPPGGAPGGFGAPPGGAPGVPPQAAAAGFGQPPGQMGGAPGGYGAPPGGAPGGAPGGFGGMAQAGGAMMGGAMGAMQGAPGGAVKTRNPMMVLGLSTGLLVLGNILARILAAISPSLALVGSLVNLVGFVFFWVFTIQMLLELKKFTRNESFNWWFCFIPCFNLYFFGWILPPEVQRAKQMAGSANQSTKHLAAYIFVAPWALASDLNDVANPRGMG